MDPRSRGSLSPGAFVADHSAFHLLNVSLHYVLLQLLLS